MQIRRTSDSWWNRSKIQVSGPSSWRLVPRWVGGLLGRLDLHGMSHPSCLPPKRVLVPPHPLFPSTPFREKNSAFLPSSACAFTLDCRKQAGPAAQPSHQPRADPSGGPTLPPAANLRALPTSPTPAEEGDISSSVTNQDEAQSCKY